MTLERAAPFKSPWSCAVALTSPKSQSKSCAFAPTSACTAPRPHNRDQEGNQSIARRCKRVRVRACASTSGDSQIDSRYLREPTQKLHCLLDKVV